MEDQAKQQQTWWQKNKLLLRTATVIILIVFALAVHLWGWGWTGFTGGESKVTKTPQGTNIEYSPGKTLWDWLNLLGVLAIPAVVGLGAAWYTAQQGKVSERENRDNQREAAIQAYIDKISELLLENRLRESPEDSELRILARIRTLTVLRGLDSFRKGNILQFLQESGLIDKDKRIIELSGADFSGVSLSRVNLSKVDLSGVNLSRADLRGANLAEANLTKADLGRAHLSISRSTHLYAADQKADLKGANLAEANLTKADLVGANLAEANLTRADLVGANLSEANLSKAKLNRAELASANLTKADLTEATLVDRTDLVHMG